MKYLTLLIPGSDPSIADASGGGDFSPYQKTDVYLIFKESGLGES